MLPILLLAVLGALVAPTGASAASDAVWSEVTPGLQRGPQLIAPDPTQSATFTLRTGALGPRLEAAPGERTRAARGALPTVSIPLPDGSLQRFRIVESPVMEPGLAAKVPEFTSYAAIGIDDPTATARLDLSPLGFHATVRSASGSWFVDPADGLAPERHIAYRGTRREGAGLREPIESGVAAEPGPAARPAPGALVPRREYRLALASDPSYASEFGAENVNTAKATLVNRANQIYNDDLAIKMILVDGNEQLNFNTTASFAFGGGPGKGYVTAMCTDPTLDANQRAIDAIIGAPNYDIGHLVSASNGGGLAGLGVVGQNGVEALGCTGVPNPRGDGFAIDYFAHELGHQFGGNHTFDGSAGNCGEGNRNEGTSVEPGSGSSVMAYAGICETDNLQDNTDPYFSQRSLTEIQAYVGSPISRATNGGTVLATGNRAPVVAAPAPKTIPARTPFTLSGSATDPDGNALIYLWEQNDTGSGSALTSNTKPDGALFRQFGTAAIEDPRQSPAPGQNQATAAGVSRTFPDLAQILSGNTNAASGTCADGVGAVECFSEFLPTGARTMNFRLTARDRVLSGGGESSADTQITVAGSVPFRVTSQAAPASVAGGAAVPVTWDVAGTSGAPVGAANVRIRYSSDGGQSFPTVLAESTANDGSRTVAIPNAATTRGRFKVEAVDNYFFDISRADLTVTPGTAPGPDPDPDPTPTTPPPPPSSTSPSPPPATSAPPTSTAPGSGPDRQAPIPTPTPLTGEAAKNPAKIRVLRAGVEGERLDVLAEITRRASGTVRVAYRSGGVTTRFNAKIDDGRIRFKRKLSGANARKTTGIFTLTYAGDGDVRADEVRLRAANGRAGLRRGTTRINAGILEVSGTISKRARGVVRIRLEYLDGSRLVLDTFRARITDGRWSLEEKLPAAAAVSGGQLSIQFTGYEPARMRGEQSAKQVAPG